MPTLKLTKAYDPTDATSVYLLKNLIEALTTPIIGRLHTMRLELNPNSPAGSVWVDMDGRKPTGNPLPSSPDVLQVETATIVGTIGAGGAGNATITVTAAGMTNSPKAISVAVANNDTASQVAGKVRTALAADVNVSAFFTVSGATDKVILTAKTAAANDATMNIASDNGTCSGLTAQPTSANTTAGSSQGSYGVDLSTLTDGFIQSGYPGNHILPENIWLAGQQAGMLIDMLYDQI